METRFLDQKTEMEKCEEGYRNFDLKPLTKEEVAWLEEHFIDFCREYWVTLDELVDMREACKGLKDCTTYRITPEGTVEIVEEN